MEILPFETTWIDLAGIMLTEIHQTEKGKIPYDFTNMQKPKKHKKTEIVIENKQVVARAGSEKEIGEGD